uniref:Uncharacterized protein n=1 Tax=Rhizophora mucronata TaxID=61149 RepID=A0A2P2NC79_RHIMU
MKTIKKVEKSGAFPQRASNNN